MSTRRSGSLYPPITVIDALTGSNEQMANPEGQRGEGKTYGRLLNQNYGSNTVHIYYSKEGVVIWLYARTNTYVMLKDCKAFCDDSTSQAKDIEQLMNLLSKPKSYYEDLETNRLFGSDSESEEDQKGETSGNEKTEEKHDNEQADSKQVEQAEVEQAEVEQAEKEKAEKEKAEKEAEVKQQAEKQKEELQELSKNKKTMEAELSKLMKQVSQQKRKLVAEQEKVAMQKQKNKKPIQDLYIKIIEHCTSYLESKYALIQPLSTYPQSMSIAKFEFYDNATGRYLPIEYKDVENELMKLWSQAATTVSYSIKGQTYEVRFDLQSMTACQRNISTKRESEIRMVSASSYSSSTMSSSEKACIKFAYTSDSSIPFDFSQWKKDLEENYDMSEHKMFAVPSYIFAKFAEVFDKFAQKRKFTKDKGKLCATKSTLFVKPLKFMQWLITGADRNYSHVRICTHGTSNAVATKIEQDADGLNSSCLQRSKFGEGFYLGNSTAVSDAYKDYYWPKSSALFFLMWCPSNFAPGASAFPGYNTNSYASPNEVSSVVVDGSTKAFFISVPSDIVTMKKAEGFGLLKECQLFNGIVCKDSLHLLVLGKALSLN